MKIPQFILFSSLILVLLMALVYLFHTYWIPDTSQMAMLVAIFVSFSTGILAYILNYTGLKAETRRFMAGLVVAMFTKMLVGIFIVVVVAVSYEDMVKEYVITYFFSYFIFTAFEVYGLMRKLRA